MKEGKLRLSRDQKHRMYVIHYSCGDFMGGDSIHTIAVQRLESMTAKVFSIVAEAESRGVDAEDISSKYSELEREVISKFYHYMHELLTRSDTPIFLHWNMRNITYGFAALEARALKYRVKPVDGENLEKINMADEFSKKYGAYYVDDPKMLSLLKLNGLFDEKILHGSVEARFLGLSKYREVDYSTQQKVDKLAAVANLEMAGKLEVRPNPLFQRIRSELKNELRERPTMTSMVIISFVISMVMALISVTNWWFST